MNDLRQSGFRLGQCHGKIRAENDKAEAQLQRDVFFLGSAAFELARNSLRIIRWAGYEMPLFQASRDRSIDLVGYDSEFNVYLVELKRGSSREKLPTIVEQINRYADYFQGIRDNVQDEFNKTFFSRVQFQEVRKVILAPRRFFPTNLPETGDIAFACFARLPQDDEQKLLKRKSPLRISLLNRKIVAKNWTQAKVTSSSI